jgi:hypothetical protein
VGPARAVGLEHLRALDADYAAFAIYTPYPGTEAFEDGAKKGLYPAECWDKLMKDPLCGEKVPVCWEEFLTRDELLDMLKVCHRRFYFRPRFVARQLKNLQSPQELKRLVDGAMSLVRLELTKTSSANAPV